MSKFTDIPWFTIYDYVDNILNPSIPDNDVVFNTANGGTLHRPNSTIITQDMDVFEVYKKGVDDTYSPLYIPLKTTISSDWYTTGDNNDHTLKLKRSLIKNIISSGDILRNVTESSYEKTTYVTTTTDYKHDITNGDDLYIKKDSTFHNWLSSNWDSYDGFLNPDKLFLYLGSGYKNNVFINILHYTLKDWMIKALPENNRNTILNDFIFLLYDKLYHKVYETQKNIYSLIDPYEIDKDKINTLPTKIYNEDEFTSDIDTYIKRIYADSLIYSLKKRGTYSVLYNIWNTLTNNTQNQLTIYDRWHTADDIDDYTDYDYTEYYNGGTYPTVYSLNDKIMSPHYKVEFSFDNDPFSTKILTKEIIDDLYNKWESSRPVTKFPHYNVIGTIVSDFSGDFVQLWDDPLYDANIYTKTTSSLSGYNANIFIQTEPSEVWLINHTLSTKNMLVHVYDFNLKRIIPQKIDIMTDSYIRIYFPYENTGSVFLIGSDYTHPQSSEANTWTVNHLLNQQYVLAQSFNDEKNNIQPKTITATDPNTLNVEFNSIKGYEQISEPDHVHTQDIANTEWTINHELGVLGVMVDVYDHNDKQIMPANVSLNTTQQCVLTFSTPVSGVCSVLEIGTPIFSNIVPINFTNDWKIKIGNGEDLDDWDYVTQNDIKNTFHTIDCNGTTYFTEYDDRIHIDFSIPEDIEGYITEIGIFNDSGDIFWASKIDNLYKHKKFIINITYNIKYSNI